MNEVGQPQPSGALQIDLVPDASPSSQGWRESILPRKANPRPPGMIREGGCVFEAQKCEALSNRLAKELYRLAPQLHRRWPGLDDGKRETTMLKAVARRIDRLCTKRNLDPFELTPRELRWIIYHTWSRNARRDLVRLSASRNLPLSDQIRDGNDPSDGLNDQLVVHGLLCHLVSEGFRADHALAWVLTCLGFNSAEVAAKLTHATRRRYSAAAVRKLKARLFPRIVIRARSTLKVRTPQLFSLPVKTEEGGSL